MKKKNGLKEFNMAGSEKENDDLIPELLLKYSILLLLVDMVLSHLPMEFCSRKMQ